MERLPPSETEAAPRASSPLAAPGERRSPRQAACVWGTRAALVAVACKAVVLALVAHDGAAVPWRGLWWPVALFHQDLAQGLVFGALAALVALVSGRARRPAIGERLSLILYLLLAFYAALNVPITRHLSSPLTYGFLHAAGGALGDSLSRFVTVGTIVAPLALMIVSVALVVVAPLRPRAATGTRDTDAPREKAPRSSRRLSWEIFGVTGVVVALLLLGPPAVARVDTRGLERNALFTLLSSILPSLARARTASADAQLEGSLCAPEPGSPGLGEAPRRYLAGAKGRNLVWVILESTGARFLPFASEPRARDAVEPMPQLAALANEGLVFDRAYASYPESIKGLFASLCGRAPPPGREASELGVGRVPCTSVAEELRRAGYRTGLFHSGWFAYLGMRAVIQGRGFDRLLDAQDMNSPHRSSFGIDDATTAHELLRWVDEERLGASERPFFAVFMPIAGHHPYRAPGLGHRPRPETSDRDAYLNDLFVADEAFGLLRAGLVARGLDARTTYVVVGDHGEAFREHPGNIAHALFVYEENVRVPLVITAPGSPGGGLHTQLLASNVDLAPTLLALAAELRGPASPRAPAAQAFEGRSLLAGTPRVARFYTEQASSRLGLRDGRWKLIHEADQGRTRLFDLDADPGETVDLADQEPARVLRYRACLLGR